MPKDLRDEVAEFYDELCARAGVTDVPVAARSAGPASHPGQYESYMNAAGTADVLENIVKVWSSTFNTRSLIARARKGLPLDHDPIGVAVLQMVDARAAGVMFTAEPTTADANTVVIEGSWGLGEVVVSGAVIPDNWTVDATSAEGHRMSPFADVAGARRQRGCRRGRASDVPRRRRGGGDRQDRQAHRAAFRQAARHRMGGGTRPDTRASSSCRQDLRLFGSISDSEAREKDNGRISK